MDGERYLKRSALIEQMKQFCIDNQIYNFAFFCEYCRENNQEWYKELVTGTQICKYMSKYLKH